ncbi:Armadillo-type fold [Phytophthora cinnamomi]|uniref:Armadillo-type fold n=1 Tax=Phytophthora cinnamomi TaxID=4785 RepID=UPI00355A03C7|nr:Armadillo-type fold [Phytophthora cinnamomi]
MDDIVDDDGAGEVVNEDEETQDEAEVNADEESDDQADPDDDDEAGEDNPNDDGAYEIDLGAGAEDDEEEIQEASGDDDRQSDQTQEEECENEEPEHEMPVLEAEIARVLDDGCSVVQLKLEEHLLTQKHRLAHCEQQVQSAIKQRLERVAMYEQLLAQGKRERNDLQTQVEILNTELRREQEQRADEREWLAELWPDNVPLPTLLLPIKKAIDARRGVVAAEPVKFVKDLSDDQGRRRLEALMTRRVEGERVRRQLEEVANWKLVLPENPEDGDGQVPYYTNTHTGVSVWDAPVAMLFEAPPGWNMATMDWEESYGLENFYPGAQGRVPRLSNMLDDENDVEGTDSEGEDAADSGAKVNVDEEEDEDEEDDAPMDPMPARERFEEEMKRYEQLKNEVQQSAAKQRSLAMEVLTANRELFEQEQEVLKEEDAAVIAVERKRRIAEKEEQAAAKAKAEAEQRKAQQASTGKASVVPVFARDSVARKGLTLAADDQVFEQELRDFAVAQRVDRLYLSIPLTRDPRVRERHRLEPEFVHTKHVESRVLEAEKLEFDLLEKSTLRHEEAASKAAGLRELCEQIRDQQRSVEEELVTVETSIARLEAEAAPPPEQPRPTEEELERAAGRYLTVEPLSSDEEQQEENGGEEENENEDDANAESASALHEDAEKTEDVAEEPAPTTEQVDHSVSAASENESAETIPADAPPDRVDDARMQMDESELRELKAFTDAELAWRQWEKAEKTRCTKLNKLSDRHSLLTTSQKQLAVDLALYEDADAPFFERLRDLEKAANTRMWELQAQTQVVRARFVVERATREESVFQMRDRLKELQQQLEDAYALPLQAIHPLERVELEVQSQKQVESLKKQETELQARYAKEEEAKALLISLELRSCDYTDAKLQEETKLFAEKQALWDLNFTLVDELQSCRQTIERLYLLMQHENDDEPKSKTDNEGENQESQADPEHESPAATDEDANGDAEPSPRELYEENARVFETKLQYLQQVRRFLLMCYDREDRWRELAATTFVKDTTSDEWMTSMQLSRQEDTLGLLQTQHEEQQQALQRQIKLLIKVKTSLQAQIDDLNAKMRRLQSDYQYASERVRLQTQAVIKALRAETEEHKAVLEKEKLKFRSDREQLIREHDMIREELEKRLQGLDDVIDKQTHWLTAAKRELHAQRVANEELLKAYQSLEKRRAAEVNDMRFRISAQIKKINNIEMWNLSMKISAKEAHTDFINMQKDMAKQQQQHKQLQRGLRLLNWRHRVTAQTILTDVNLLFSFFADGIAILAGATPEINDTLRENAGIEVLAALARHSSQQSVRAICARALGQLSWNANVTARSLGWKAKQKWFQWMKTQSTVVLDKLSASKTAFDAVAEEGATEMNWLADPSAPIDDISGESDHDLSSKGGKDKAKKLLFTETWQQFDEKAFPDTNVANQQYMGLSSNVLQTILDLCRSPDTDKLVKRNALHSLALIVRSSRNTSIIGRLDGSVALLVSLLERKSDMTSDEDPQVVRHAVQALANLAYQNAFNQQLIFTQGGIPLLLRLCDRAVSSSDALDADVDLTLATTQTLSHLSHDHVLSCQAIVEARGISILTRLCNSPRIHDAIDLEVYELIQTYASQVIANAITLLDQEDSESNHRSYRIADFILEEQAGLPEYSSGVGRANEKPSHDNQEQHNDEQHTQQPPKHAGVSTFVLMCASCNRNVAFHGAVVLGSIAQHDAIRGAIGTASGMDALFLLAARTEDLPMVAQATWALANLTWNRDNQYRVARYIDRLYQICTLGSGHTALISLNQEEADQQHEENQDGDDVQPEDPAAKAQRRQQDELLTRQIREHGLCILANSLFYNDANRQLIASHGDWMQLLARNALEADGATLENSARALCSLSYSDSIALSLGSSIFVDSPKKAGTSKNAKNSMTGLHIFIRLCGRAGNVSVQQHGLFGVINMCLHDSNKTRMLEIPHGIDTLVNLSGHNNKELSEPALEALELLADLRQLKQDHGISSAQSFESVDMKKLIALLSDATNPSLVAMISDAIADEVWKRPSAQVRLRNEHGLEKLLEICAKPSPLFPAATSGSSPATAAEIERRVRISCLWALRNTVASNVRNQDLVGALGGVQQLVSVYDRERQSEEVVEALLAALVAVVMKHPRNSQQLVQFGLDMLITLADGTEDGDRLEEDRHSRDQRGGILPPLNPSASTRSTTASPAKRVDSSTFTFVTKTEEKQLENATLARELLHLVAPYNTRDAAPVSPDAKVRRMQQLHSLSASPVHRR